MYEFDVAEGLCGKLDSLGESILATWKEKNKKERERVRKIENKDRKVPYTGIRNIHVLLETTTAYGYYINYE